jgi:RNA polymerase sigma-70 factor (ECF subfamily)
LPAAVEPTLVGLWDTGRTAWPGIVVELESFAIHVAQRVGSEPIESSLAGVHAADLYLSCACSAGNAAALAAFDKRYLSQIGGFVARMSFSPAFVEELAQVLREKLFVGDAPKIGEYSGRGALHNWLRVVSVRTALNLTRRRTEVVVERVKAGPTQEYAASQPDPELGYIKSRFASDLTEAINAAFSQLSSQQRQILRLRFLEDIPLDQMAAQLGVHRATVVRWVAEARQTVRRHAQQWFQDRFKLPLAELDSLMDLARSGLDLSISRLLQSAS